MRIFILASFLGWISYACGATCHSEDNMTFYGYEHLDFVPPASPVLSTVAEEIPITSITKPDTQALIDKILEMAGANRSDPTRRVLVGLAAPQLGIAKRVILVDTGANGKGSVSNVQIFINPVILSQSEEQNEWYEACYSTSYVTGIVPRSTTVTIFAYNEAGEPVTGTYSGYVARIFQHEIDHLNGIRFPSRISNLDHLHWVLPDQMMLYRNQEGWRHWTVKCPIQVWEAIRTGQPFEIGNP